MQKLNEYFFNAFYIWKKKNLEIRNVLRLRPNAKFKRNRSALQKINNYLFLNKLLFKHTSDYLLSQETMHNCFRRWTSDRGAPLQEYTYIGTISRHCLNSFSIAIIYQSYFQTYFRNVRAVTKF